MRFLILFFTCILLLCCQQEKKIKKPTWLFGKWQRMHNEAISQGETLQLLESISGNASGSGFFSISSTQGEGSETDSRYTGELTITKFDFTNKIVSGTFWFDIKHPTTGATVEIREGRFDTLFTQ
ncbi:hypothetical protein P8625_15040 [Tenacibaculum tangerinum]|uniref:Lipocalin-like domain-containing protein n=1 Tax=Tenacibaculum tangerinum TaxID=3038772 RepID=A0ABY8L1Q3_9FLAO|nr:hypothetical protein [Tenacibaculum tangerinum]WGH75368.1 hypothetical protein P8625_15040 [Tenacibaculum tangerinum]